MTAFVNIYRRMAHYLKDNSYLCGVIKKGKGMKHIVVLTGAGISAESGLLTFRDINGLWTKVNAEELASIQGYRKDRAKVLAFYNERRKNLLDVQPNHAHLFLAELEKEYKVSIITQNVDDLLQSHTARTMLANSEFVALLKQANTDSSKMAEVIGVSDAQLRFVTNSQSGMGLLKCGNVVIPFDNQIGKDTSLYKLYNTNIHEKIAEQKAKKIAVK